MTIREEGNRPVAGLDPATHVCDKGAENTDVGARLKAGQEGAPVLRRFREDLG